MKTKNEIKEIVDRGEAEAYINDFVAAIFKAQLEGRLPELDVDTATVAAEVLARLMKTAACRKLLHLPKRKNIQWNAKDYRMGSPQWEAAKRHYRGDTTCSEAVKELSDSFGDHPPSEARTLKRLLDDLVERVHAFDSAVYQTLINLGADPDKPGSHESAARRMFKNLTGSDWDEVNGPM
ncbi:hypothetical protein [Azonexus hydrophilus]|uniref:hypothetical protein n=1 Tax=Azonexus hydrophilus TaxID=418702 RepID=UPI001965F1D3|nr:hypothetical protein [Azonexus hydrophilus]